METERFAVPEILFHPSDISQNQAGLPEATAQAMQHLSVEEVGKVIQQVVLTGGNTKFPNFRSRFEENLRPLILDVYNMEVVLPDQPDLYAWKSARKYLWDLRQHQTDNANSYNSQYHGFTNHFITKQAYAEQGHQRCNDFFDSAW